MATLQFLGASQEVTGSCYLFDSPATGRLLLDCGMRQEESNNHPPLPRFRFDPRQIGNVILSHAHLDHSGMLPRLVHEGFTGTIHCTDATRELLEIMLLDSQNIYQRDLERTNLRRARHGEKPIKALYAKPDVLKTLKRCKPHAYGKPFKLSPEATITFHDAGHILGSAISELTFTEKNKKKRLVFSGDLGHKDAVLMNDPAILTEADMVLMEGTYGNRDHRPMQETIDELRDVLADTWKRGGNVMIPAFAVERTQELLLHLGMLHRSGELDPWQVILDSPMAISVTKVYDHWLDTLECTGVRHLCTEDKSLLKDFLPRLHLSVTPQESMAINKIKKGAIIISGSGMCTGGRIRHHFKQRIWEKRNTVIFIGFQARGTLGRIIVDGASFIRLWGEEFCVKARIATIGGFSAHAGQTELVEWISHFRTNPRIFLVHGEPESLDALSQKLWEEKGIPTEVATPGQSVAF
jgi:metallo-beta-lactamase family protein